MSNLLRKFKKFILKILRLPSGYKKHKEIEKSIITIEINIFLQKGHDVLTKIILNNMGKYDIIR